MDVCVRFYSKHFLNDWSFFFGSIYHSADNGGRTTHYFPQGNKNKTTTHCYKLNTCTDKDTNKGMS